VGDTQCDFRELQERTSGIYRIVWVYILALDDYCACYRQLQERTLWA